MKNLIAFYNILKKDIKNYYLKPPNISWGIIFPLSWSLMQLLRSADGDILQLLSGLLATSVLFGTTSMLAVTITFERSSRSFERLLLAPISLNTLILAKINGAILFGIFNAFVSLIFVSFFTNLSLINWPILILAIVLIAITSALLGLFVAVSVEQVFEAQTLSNFFRFPMLFLCGLYIPISKLPIYLKVVSYFLPLTYGVDILNGAINSTNTLSFELAIIMLMILGFILFMASKYNINRKWLNKPFSFFKKS